jgi:hypothetical protein
MGNSFGGLLVLNPYLFLKIANFAGVEGREAA